MPALSNEPKLILAKDYTAPDFLIHEVDLDFDLHETKTQVISRLKIERNGSHDNALHLHGEDLILVSVRLDNKVMEEGDYKLRDNALIVQAVPNVFELEIRTEINPAQNTELSGLYLSGGNFCTQCEAEGFRRITYFLDRPDVLARYTTIVRADKKQYPVLLSNGNPGEAGDGPDGRHWVKWIDPFPKPSYLFALVAGDLKAHRDQFITASGRHVDLAIHVAARDLPKCGHAMTALKKAMKWDEDVYGLEYDLDIYNIVAVSDFNMGAMENKGLNVFNTRYVLASPETATDKDFEAVEGVIAHEYFHNWTGNRVTCRDWFQLSLKEGLTVFRDQEFSADQGSRAVKRIEDVRILRSVQFPEDAGPMAHPIRPESYIEINNFYTPTVYNKGAEVIRMMHQLLGAGGFRAGMDLYFKRHDGAAVTCEDFVAAMEAANGADLSQFRLWYSQAGTPNVAVEFSQDIETQSITLAVTQSIADTPGQANKAPMNIPIVTAFIGESGNRVSSEMDGGATASEHVVILEKKEQKFVFRGVTEKVTPSLLRGFSAPIRLSSNLKARDLEFLAQYDDDPFNRWEAIQKLAGRQILDHIDRNKSGGAPYSLTQALKNTIEDTSLSPGLIAEAIILPSELVLGEQMDRIDVDALHRGRQAFHESIAFELSTLILNKYREIADRPGKAERALKNALLRYLAIEGNEEGIAIAMTQFSNADNMTDELGALSCLADLPDQWSRTAIDAFYKKWVDEDLVIDKWFSVQALSKREDVFAHVMKLSEHEAFNRKNPNRLRALVGSFAFGNQRAFHEATGAAYQFLKGEVLNVDRFNPQAAARLLNPLGRWRRFDDARGALMRQALQEIVDTADVSKDVYEIASKSLA